MKPLLWPEDVADGWKQRKTPIERTKVPTDHGLSVNGVFEPMSSLVCDNCGEKIQEAAIAVTHWRGEGEPRFWEAEYGA